MAVSQPLQTANSVSTADTICCFILWEGRKEGRKEDYLFITAFRGASPQGPLSSALGVWNIYILVQILPYGKALP